MGTPDEPEDESPDELEGESPNNLEKRTPSPEEVDDNLKNSYNSEFQAIKDLDFEQIESSLENYFEPAYIPPYNISSLSLVSVQRELFTSSQKPLLRFPCDPNMVREEDVSYIEDVIEKWFLEGIKKSKITWINSV